MSRAGCRPYSDSMAHLDSADPAVLNRFAGDSARSGDRLDQVRGRLAAASISPQADRFGLLDDLVRQEADARRQVADALTALADGCGDLDRSARSFAQAFQVAMEVR